MKIRYDTPSAIASILTKYAPSRVAHLLDPCVGGGALIAPMIDKLSASHSQVYCVDSDRNVFGELGRLNSIGSNIEFKYINADFLDWSEKDNQIPLFDSVVMNPPFAGKKRQHLTIDVQRELFGTEGKVKKVPVEVAFVLRAVRLLKSGGRLLAILPCSVVMSEGLEWFREYLVECGAIRSVHELPQGTFRGVESRLYLFVYDKGRPQRKVTLLNHDVAKPERMCYRIAKGQPVGRLDFGYRHAVSKVSELIAKTQVKWDYLREIASIKRGSIASPDESRSCVHTSDFVSGYWRKSPRHVRPVKNATETTIQRGDILVKRVGRGCTNSFGEPVGLRDYACSDCILIVRPMMSCESTRLLFSLRCLFSWSWASPLVVRGTGAMYISTRSLRELTVPIGLSSEFPTAYRRFCKAIANRAENESVKISQDVAKQLDYKRGQRHRS